MKKFFISTCLLFLGSGAIGQAQESTFPITKEEAVNRQAAKIQLPYSPEVVIEALNDITNTKGSAIKAASYQTLQGTKLMANNKDMANMHFYVKQKSSTDPNVSDLYLNLLSSNGEKTDMTQPLLFTMQ